MTFKSLGRLQNVKRLLNFGRLPIKFWEAPNSILGGSQKKLGGSKTFRDPIFFFYFKKLWRLQNVERL
jgi:hypothetical protein